MRKNHKPTLGKRQHVSWGMNRQKAIMKVNVPSIEKFSVTSSMFGDQEAL